MVSEQGALGIMRKQTSFQFHLSQEAGISVKGSITFSTEINYSFP